MPACSDATQNTNLIAQAPMPITCPSCVDGSARSRRDALLQNHTPHAPARRALQHTIAIHERPHLETTHRANPPAFSLPTEPCGLGGPGGPGSSALSRRAHPLHHRLQVAHIRRRESEPPCRAAPHTPRPPAPSSASARRPTHPPPPPLPHARRPARARGVERRAAGAQAHASGPPCGGRRSEASARAGGGSMGARCCAAVGRCGRCVCRSAPIVGACHRREAARERCSRGPRPRGERGRGTCGGRTGGQW